MINLGGAAVKLGEIRERMSRRHALNDAFHAGAVEALMLVTSHDMTERDEFARQLEEAGDRYAKERA